MSKERVASRNIGFVPDSTWHRFAGYAKLNGMKHPEFLERLLQVYENYLRKTQIEESSHDEKH